MEIIAQILQFKSPEQIYHSDGDGHVQIETIIDEDCDPDALSPSELFARLDELGQWQQWQRTASEQSSNWLYDLMTHIKVQMKEDPCQLQAWLSCFFALSTKHSLLCALGDFSRLPMAQASQQQIQAVIERVETLRSSTPISEDEDLRQYLEQRMVKQALEELHGYL